MPRGAVAHPCAEADNPGGVILHGGEGCVGGRTVAHVFDEQGRRAVLLGNFADVGNALDGVSADAAGGRRRVASPQSRAGQTPFFTSDKPTISTPSVLQATPSAARRESVASPG